MNQTIIDMIISNVARAFIFFLASGLYVFLLTKTIPQFTLKHRSVGDNTKDRGIKKYTFEGGRAVVYEPEVECRPYVSQYMLIAQNGHKFIKCLVNTRVRHIKYDVVAYDYQNKLIDIVSVEEHMRNQEHTTSVLLPPETSYVSFVLRRVDKMFVSTDVRVVYQRRSLILCAALIVAATILQGLIIDHCLQDVWKLIYYFIPKLETYASRRNAFKTIIASGIVGAAVSALIVRVYMKKNVKVTNR